MKTPLREKFLETVSRLMCALTLEKQREAWAATGLVSREELDELIDQVRRVNATGIVTVSIAQIQWSRGNLDRVRFWSGVRKMNGFPEVPPDRVVRETIADQIKCGAVPENWAATCDCATVKPGLKIGETLVQMGAASEADVNEALAKQAAIERLTGFRFRLGGLMRALGMITWGEYLQAMAFKHGVPFTNFDETMERLVPYEATKA